MTQSLKETFRRLLDAVQSGTFRNLYHHIKLSDRLTGIVGPRGVGKTTLMLQYIRFRLEKPQEAFYCSADHFAFQKLRLWDLVEELWKTEGIRYFFFDEIHRYPQWNQELKNIYDSFPEVKVIFSGSSSLDLIKGHYDLSRRGRLFRLSGLSFREYLNFQTGQTWNPVSWEDLLQDPEKASRPYRSFPKLMGYFRQYLQQGYYPFSSDDFSSYAQKVLNTVQKSIYEDIASFYKLKTEYLHLFKKILLFAATISPGELNVHHLAVGLRIDDKTAHHYLNILEEIGLIRLLYSDKKGNALIRKPEKIYLDNTVLAQSLCHELGQSPNIGTIRELFFLQALQNTGRLKPLYSSQGDFRVGKAIFEIGGKNKSRAQLRLKSGETGYVVQDDILSGDRSTIPLYLLGFLEANY